MDSVDDEDDDVVKRTPPEFVWNQEQLQGRCCSCFLPGILLLPPPYNMVDCLPACLPVPTLLCEYTELKHLFVGLGVFLEGFAMPRQTQK